MLGALLGICSRAFIQACLPALNVQVQALYNILSELPDTSCHRRSVWDRSCES